MWNWLWRVGWVAMIICLSLMYEVQANAWLSEARSIRAQLKGAGKSARNWRASMNRSYKTALMRRTLERALRAGPNRMLRTGFVPDFDESLHYFFQRGLSYKPFPIPYQGEALGLLEMQSIRKENWISFVKDERVLQTRMDVNRGYSNPAMIRGVIEESHITNLKRALGSADGVTAAYASSLAKDVPVENISHFGLFTMKGMFPSSQIEALEGIQYLSTKVDAFKGVLGASSRGREFLDDIPNLIERLKLVDNVEGNEPLIEAILNRWE